MSWLTFAGSVVARPNRGEYNAWLDAGLYQVPFLLAATCCVLRARRGETGAAAWWVIGAGLLAFVGGNLYGSLVVGDRDIFPSPADGLWLGFYLTMYVAIVLLVKSKMTQFQPSTWLDGAVGGLAAAALAVAFALGPALAETEGKFAVVATTIAYPTADLLLIIILVTSGSAVRTRDRSFWMLGFGLGVFCFADVIYMFQESNDSYQEGGLLDIVWPLAATIIGLAACSLRATERDRAEAKPQVVIPSAAAVSAIALLCFGQRHEVPMTAVVFATLALIAGTVRVGLTIREVRALAESRREARTDELTGLANRRLLIEQLTVAVDESDAPATLLIADLDGFKEINDSLGHVAGDELLRSVGRRLDELAPRDAVVARLGGDEFALVLLGCSPDDAVALAEEVRHALRVPFAIHGIQVTIDISIGVAGAPVHGTTAVQIMARADVAMFRAKRERVGVAVFDPEGDTPSRDRLELLADLRIAFDEEQFVVHYQPQLDIMSGRIIGLEALVRWRHPVRGLVAPDLFIPMVEQSNLMSKLTAQVLRRALSDCAALRRRGTSLRMAVNISASDLIGTELADLIAELLAEYDLPPSALVVEVTEQSVMADRVRCLLTLRRLRDSGVHISVDDYGTGEASLSYIRDLPITELKLDRSFLHGVPGDTHNAAIIRSTIELAHALGLPIVAEGIEDDATLDWLHHLGCDLGQGFHIARPTPLEDLLHLLEGPGRVSPSNASAEALPVA